MKSKMLQREEDLHLESAIAEMVAVETGRQALSFPETAVPMDEPDIAGMRKRLGYTQERLAETLNIPVATLRNWEQGRRQPGTAARLLFRLLDLSSNEPGGNVPGAIGMKKSDLVSAVSRKANIPEGAAQSAVEAVFQGIKAELNKVFDRPADKPVNISMRGDRILLGFRSGAGKVLSSGQESGSPESTASGRRARQL